MDESQYFISIRLACETGLVGVSLVLLLCVYIYRWVAGLSLVPSAGKRVRLLSGYVLVDLLVLKI